jgi:Tfp pilus assembly protein PilO
MTFTIRRLGIITGAAILFLVVVWYLALFQPQSHKLTATRAVTAAADQKITSLQLQVSQLTALEKEIPSDTAKLRSYTAAVPDNPQLALALKQIEQVATGTGVNMTALAPQAASTSSSSSSSASKSGTPSIAVQLSISGTYAQDTAFVSALTALPRTLVVQSVNLNGTNNGQQVSGSLSTDIYYSGQPTP